MPFCFYFVNITLTKLIHNVHQTVTLSGYTLIIATNKITKNKLEVLLMKKYLSLIISGLLLTSMGTVAFADTTTDLSADKKANFIDKKTEAINKAVESGRLTEEQADKILEAINNGSFTRIGAFDKSKMTGEMKDRVAKLKVQYKDEYSADILSNLTDLSVSEIESLRENNNSYMSIAKDNEVVDEYVKELRATRAEAKETRLQELLDSGKITQEKYDSIKENQAKMEKVRELFTDFREEANDIANQELADTTGKTVDEIVELRENHELRDYLKSQELDKEVFESIAKKLTEAKADYAKDLLDNGEITQDEYDTISKYLEKKPGLRRVKLSDSAEKNFNRADKAKRVVDFTDISDKM